MISLFKKKEKMFQSRKSRMLINMQGGNFLKDIDPSHLRFDFPQGHLLNHLDS